MRMRKKKNLEPRMEACGEIFVRNPKEHRGKWQEFMPNLRQIHLELGCGKGRFTCGTAAELEDVLIIAVERVPDAMVIAMERSIKEELANVLFIDGDAANLSEYFAPEEIDRIYINFCDPWPSKRHAKRRLTAENFLKSYRFVLKEGGEVHFKTDNRDLFDFSLFQFPKAGYELSEVTFNRHGEKVEGIMTDYEEKFHNMGMPIHRCVGKVSALPEGEISLENVSLPKKWLDEKDDVQTEISE